MTPPLRPAVSPPPADDVEQMPHEHYLQDVFRDPNPPEPRPGWALFLDLDGTLLDIAPTPDRVVVPPDLTTDLAAASIKLGGALAIVSGRMMSEVDALLAPLRLPGGGEHAAVLRLPDGHQEEVDAKVPLDIVNALDHVADRKAGLIVERKTHSVVLHYRRAAHEEEFCRTLCDMLITGRERDLEVLEASMAVEIRPSIVSKARAVNRLMAMEPFRGRSPVFVGDDITDEDGFRAAEALGGEGLDVFTHFGGRPKQVRLWLKAIAKL
jgi:trehalose 6-phosphate phosphatase